MPFYTFFPLTKRKRSLCSQAAPVSADSSRTPWDANTNPSLRQAGIYPGRTGTPELGRRKRPPLFLIFSPMLPRPTLVFARRPASRAQAVPQQQPCSSESKRHGHFCRAFPNRAQLQPGGIFPVSVRSPSKLGQEAHPLLSALGFFRGLPYEAQRLGDTAGHRSSPGAALPALVCAAQVPRAAAAPGAADRGSCQPPAAAPEGGEPGA